MNLPFFRESKEMRQMAEKRKKYKLIGLTIIWTSAFWVLIIILF